MSNRRKSPAPGNRGGAINNAGERSQNDIRAGQPGLCTTSHEPRNPFAWRLRTGDIATGSLVQLDLVPFVVFVAKETTTRTVTLRHPNGAPLTVPVWRVRQIAGVLL